jgi:hypothetical protein
LNALTGIDITIDCFIILILENSDDLGHVTRKIVSESSKPVLLLN